jgi:hypothetical protein
LAFPSNDALGTLAGDLGGTPMDRTLARNLDPLDREVVERAIQGLSETIEADRSSGELDSDEGLEIALRRELAEMVRAHGVSDPDVLLDMVIEGSSESDGRA